MPYLTPNAAAANDYICRRLLIPNERSIIEIVNGAISELLREYRYEQFGDMTPEQTVQMFQVMYMDYIESDACMLGMIMPFASTTCPPNCLECDGAIYERAGYPRLWEVLDDSLKINDDQFRTPNLIGVFVQGASGQFGDYPPFVTGGEEEVTLTYNQMPEHIHTANDHTHTTVPHDHATLPHDHVESASAPGVIPPGEIPLPVPNSTTIPGVTAPASVTVLSNGVTVNAAAVNINAAGSDEPHNNMPPFYRLRYAMIAR